MVFTGGPPSDWLSARGPVALSYLDPVAVVTPNICHVSLSYHLLATSHWSMTALALAPIGAMCMLNQQNSIHVRLEAAWH